MRALLLGLLITGCGSNVVGEARVSRFDLGRAHPDEPSIVAGLNLDGRVSDREDVETCGKEDFTSPGPDFEKGVDNQFGPLLDLAPHDVTAAIAPAIERGDFAMRLEVESAGADEAVVVLGGVRFSGEIHEGRLHAESAEVMTFDLPVTDADGKEARMAMRLSSPILRVTLDPDAARDGVLAGRMSVDEAIAGAVVLGFAPEESLRLVLGTNADLDPNSEGTCQNISSGFVFDAEEVVP